MTGIRKLGIVISSTVVAAIGLAVGITVGTAHAQAAESVTITGVTQTQTPTTSGQLTVSLSVTCPAGGAGQVFAGGTLVASESGGTPWFPTVGTAGIFSTE
jgi:hypothetical protein